MDDIKVGSIVRAVRIRKGLRQSDVAELAGVAQSVVSAMERGLAEELTFRSARRVAAALGVRLPFAPRWKGAELSTLLDERHAALVREAVARLAAEGWTSWVEVTFAFGREAGSVDIIGWKSDPRALLVLEVKSELTDLQDAFAAVDRKRRLAMPIARQLRLSPLLIGTMFVFPEESQMRRAVERNAVLFDRMYPTRGVQVRRWLSRPVKDLRGLWFLPIIGVRNAKRVRVQRKAKRRYLARTVAGQSSVEPTCPVSAPARTQSHTPSRPG